MKKHYYLPILMFLISFLYTAIVQGQWLTDKEKNALLAYWTSDMKLSGWGINSELSAFSTQAKQNVLNDPANVRLLKPCAIAARQYDILGKSRVKKIEEAYDMIFANFAPDYAKKFFPTLTKKNMQILKKNGVE